MEDLTLTKLKVLGQLKETTDGSLMTESGIDLAGKSLLTEPKKPSNIDKITLEIHNSILLYIDQYSQVIECLSVLSSDEIVNSYLDAINISSVNIVQYKFVKQYRPRLYYIAVQILQQINIVERCNELGISQIYRNLILEFVNNLEKEKLDQEDIFKINLILGDLSNIERLCERMAIGILS